MPRKKANKTKQTAYDPEIMAELLAQPTVASELAQMSPEMREWYIELIVKNGIYERYVRERGKK